MENFKNEMTSLAKEGKTNEMISLVKKMELLTDFIQSVRKKTLQQEIIKKISPHMFLDVNIQKKLLSVDNENE